MKWVSEPINSSGRCLRRHSSINFYVGRSLCPVVANLRHLCTSVFKNWYLNHSGFWTRWNCTSAAPTLRLSCSHSARLWAASLCGLNLNKQLCSTISWPSWFRSCQISPKPCKSTCRTETIFLPKPWAVIFQDQLSVQHVVPITISHFHLLSVVLTSRTSTFQCQT